MSLRPIPGRWPARSHTPTSRSIPQKYPLRIYTRREENTVTDFALWQFFLNKKIQMGNIFTSPGIFYLAPGKICRKGGKSCRASRIRRVFRKSAARPPHRRHATTAKQQDGLFGKKAGRALAPYQTEDRNRPIAGHGHPQPQ